MASNQISNTADKTPLPLSLAEQKLILRLRQLKSGAHLLTLEMKDGNPTSLVLWGSARGSKVEKLS